MHVAVSIVGFRNADDIAKCLKALQASTYNDFEVIICENGGSSAFSTLTAALPEALDGGQLVKCILAPSNLGYAGGVNACLRETPHADAWWVLNPDTAPTPNSMALQLARLAEGDCEAVGVTLYLPDGRIQSHGGIWQAWLARAISIGHGNDRERPVSIDNIERRQTYLNGASMMINRRFLEVTGPMREDYFLYCEEVEWCLRAINLGMRLGFAPGADVLHYQGTTTGNNINFTRKTRGPIYLGERNGILLTRDLYPWRLPLVALTTFLLLALRYLRRGAWRQFFYGLQGWAAGLLNERGPPAWFGA